MGPLPAEMRVAVSVRLEEQRVAFTTINRSKATKLYSTGMFIDRNDAEIFALIIADYAGRRFYEDVYTRSLNWRIRSHNTSGSWCHG